MSAVALLLTPQNADATDLGPAPVPMAAHLAAPVDPWIISVTPYGWALNLDGDVAVQGIDASVNINFIDLVQEADTIAALEGRVEARKGKFSLLSISDYFKATFSEDVTARAQPASILTIDVEADVSLELELILSELAATYEVFRWSQETPATKWDQPGGYIALDVLGGARYNSVDVETDIVLDVTATLTPEIIPINVTETGQIRGKIVADEQWVDPFVGLRLRMVSAGGLALFARGDVGGFGTSSDFVWQAMGGIAGECRCNERLSWAVGYRALDTDYSTGSGTEEFTFDMLIHGPVIGATYRF